MKKEYRVNDLLGGYEKSWVEGSTREKLFAALVLSHCADVPESEIAEILGAPVAKVKSLLDYVRRNQ